MQNAKTTTMRNVLHYFILTLIIIFLTNCNKCKENKIAVISFTADELSINPFTATDRITFKNLPGDSIVFLKGTRISGFYEVTKGPRDDNGCRHDYVEVDYYTLEKHCDNPKSKLSMEFLCQYSFVNNASEKDFRLNFNSLVNSQPTGDAFDGSYQFTATSLIQSTSGSEIVSYHSSIVIGPRTYDNVYELSCLNPDNNNSEWFSIAYYSLKEGLVGFKSNNGKQSWYLDKVTK